MAASLPDSALGEELAGGALESGRGNKVLPLDAVRVGLDETQEANLLVLRHRPTLAHDELGGFGFDEVVQLESRGFTTCGLPVEETIGGELGFIAVDRLIVLGS